VPLKVAKLKTFGDKPGLDTLLYHNLYEYQKNK
jgi:hypothetical protein